MAKSYIDFYKKCVRLGELPRDIDECGGLCTHLSSYPLFWILEPDRIYGYWGFNGDEIYDQDNSKYQVTKRELRRAFTPLRQNAVLLLACMNNEL